MSENPYSPRAFFTGLGDRLPRVLLSPQKYVQGPGVLNHLGEHLSLLAVEKVAVLGSKRCLENEAARAINSIKSVGIDVAIAQFGGVFSLRDRKPSRNPKSRKTRLPSCSWRRKTVDAGRCIAERLSVPIVIAPTLASNDAPCSALSVVYTTEGVQESVEFFAETQRSSSSIQRLLPTQTSATLLPGSAMPWLLGMKRRSAELTQPRLPLQALDQL